MVPLHTPQGASEMPADRRDLRGHLARAAASFRPPVMLISVRCYSAHQQVTALGSAKLREITPIGNREKQ